ncbi:MAG: tetratricopeptide repeat protein [Syntrophobacterales bacterium]|jgi:serine/threonine protein kinase
MQPKNTNQPNANGLSEIQERIQEAELYLTQGLFEEARQIYKKLLNELGPVPKGAAADPATHSSHEDRRGFIQEQLAIIDRQEAEFHGQPMEAEPAKPAAIQEGEGNAAFNRGQAFLDIGMFADAIQEFQQAAELGFQPVECSLEIGKAYFQLAQYQKGIQVLEEAYESKDLSDADRNQLLRQIAKGYEASGDTAKALEGYEQLAASDPKDSMAANKVKSLAKEDHRYNLNMVKLHLKNEQFSKAIQTLNLVKREHQVPLENLVPLYEQILQKDPGNSDASQQLSAIYRQMLDDKKGGADVKLKFARHLLQAGQIDDAASEYLEVMLEDSPLKLIALNELGEALFQRQDYDRLLELMEDALSWAKSSEPGPETFKYYYLLGRVFEKKNLYDQAKDYFQRAAAIDPYHEAIVAKVETQAKGPLISRGKALLSLRVDEKLQYQIQEKLGQDEVHQIFRISEVPSGTLRIAKTLMPELSAGDKVKDFIVKWAQEQIAMENRNISRVLDLAESEGRYYLIMEDFQITLHQLLKEKTKLPIAEAVSLARCLLNALAYAHSHRGTDDILRKIFHLALNPQRVTIRDDITKAKVSDFGLVTGLNRMLNLNQSYQEISVYQLAYMAPEQFHRSPVRMPDKMKQAADIYSFGLVFYKAITGKLPFKGPSPEDFKKQHSEKYPVPPRVFISSIPAKLDEAILKCLHKDPKKRWRTPTELDLALEKINV